jgi:hypothetical protein
MPLSKDITPDEIVGKIVDHARHLRVSRELGMAPDTEEQRKYEMIVNNTFVLLLRSLGYEWDEIKRMLT